MAEPLKILTPFPVFTNDRWSGETAVDITVETDVSRHADLIGDTDILLSQVFTAEMAQAANALKFIQSSGAGTELIDLSQVPKGCPVAIVHGHEPAIAEWVIMSMLAINRRLLQADRELRQGDWTLSYFRKDYDRELSSQTIGILGLGHIGKEVAARARAFGMRMIGATRTPPSDDAADALGFDWIVGLDDLDQVLAAADFVVLALAATPETQDMIDQSAFAKMKPDASFVNVARASLVSETALYDALSTRQIKAAAIDVWWDEPRIVGTVQQVSELPYADLDNIILSPHLSGLTTGMLERRFSAIAENIDRFARGETPSNIIHWG